MYPIFGTMYPISGTGNVSNLVVLVDCALWCVIMLRHFDYAPRNPLAFTVRVNIVCLIAVIIEPWGISSVTG